MHETGCDFEDDITLSYEEAISRCEFTDGETNDSFVKRVCETLNGGIAHYWDLHKPDVYHIRHVPLWENYIIYTIQLLKPADRGYEFYDYKRALERGVGLCSQHALAAVDILTSNGIEAHLVELDGHVVTRIQGDDGSWYIIDPDFGIIVPHDLDPIEENTDLVIPFYMSGGFVPIANSKEHVVAALANKYGPEGNRIHGSVSDYKGWQAFWLWKGSYIFKWIIPLVMIVPLILHWSVSSTTGFRTAGGVRDFPGAGDGDDGAYMYRIIKKAFLMVFYISGIWLIFRYLGRHKLAILMYHGVVDSDSIEWTQVQLKQFELQMAYIRKRYRPISLEGAIDELRLRTQSNGNIVVTFDDGFKSIHRLAYPILKRHNLPATIFMPISCLDKGESFGGLMWTSFVHALCRSSPKGMVDLPDLGLSGVYLCDERSRYRAKERICRRLKMLADEERLRILDALPAELAAFVREEDREVFGHLSWQDVKQMHDEGLISIGAHTVSHVILSRVPSDVAVREVACSQSSIRERLGSNPFAFAYPNGTRADFTDGVKQIVARHFQCGITTIEGLNGVGEDLYELKRVAVGGDLFFWEFKLHLSGLIFFLRKLVDRIRIPARQGI